MLCRYSERPYAEGQATYWKRKSEHGHNLEATVRDHPFALQTILDIRLSQVTQWEATTGSHMLKGRPHIGKEIDNTATNWSLQSGAYISEFYGCGVAARLQFGGYISVATTCF